jgi:hypothetical protein
MIKYKNLLQYLINKWLNVFMILKKIAIELIVGFAKMSVSLINFSHLNLIVFNNY